MDETFVLCPVLKAGTVYEIFNERHAPIIGAGCWYGVLDQQCLAVCLLEQVASDTWFVNVLDKNTLQDLGLG